MTKKNKRYVLAIGGLLAVHLFLFFDKGTTRTASFDDTLFSVSDTSQIRAVEISNKWGTIEIKRGGTGWILNNDYRPDVGFRTTLFAVFNRVRVDRRVGASGLEKRGAVKVELLDGNQLTFAYFTDGNKTKTLFGSSKGNEYRVSVPGYRDNIAGLFDLHPDQWRSRLVYDGNRRTILKLDLSYTDEKKQGLSIQFKDKFYAMEGVNAIDTAFIVDYLNRFQAWRANEMISPGRMKQLDSLSKTLPFATLTIEDIHHQKPLTFTIFNTLENEHYYLLKDGRDQLFVIDRKRMRFILRKRQDFKAK